MLAGLSMESTAAIVAKMPEDRQAGVMSMLGGDSLFQMTRHLFRAYRVDKSASAQERHKMKADAEEMGRRIARPISLKDKLDLGEIFRQATPEHLGGCIFALVEDSARSVTSQTNSRPVARMREDGEIEWGDGSKSRVSQDGAHIVHSDGTKATLSDDGVIIDTDGQVLRLRDDGLITSDGSIVDEKGEIIAAPSGALHFYRALTAEQRADVMRELLAFTPPGTSGKLLIELTMTEIRDLLAPMGSDDVAKALVEIARSSPLIAGRSASVLSHTEAASAISILVNPGSSQRCTEPFMGSFLEALTPQILRNVQPPTAVGGALAEHLSPTSAAQVLHKMEPMDVSRILEGMSPAEVSEVIEASVVIQEQTGKKLSDTPFTAALVPYVSAMENTQAAALLESLPTDMAVGIMMCTPDERAHEIMEHTRRRDLKDRVANKSLIHLDACTISNIRGAIVGEQSSFILESRSVVEIRFLSEVRHCLFPRSLPPRPDLVWSSAPYMIEEMASIWCSFRARWLAKSQSSLRVPDSLALGRSTSRRQML